MYLIFVIPIDSEAEKRIFELICKTLLVLYCHKVWHIVQMVKELK